MSFQIFVKSINGKSRTIDVNSTDTIASLKQKLQEKEGIAVDEQRLIYSGKSLENEKTLESYNVGADATLHLVLKVRGGKN